MGKVFMPKKTTVRVLGQDKSVDFVDVKMDDIINKFDFSYDNQSIKSITQQEQR